MTSIITLTTDFGLKDGNVGAMKGVIWKIAPHVQIADISHLIAPQNVPEAALVIYRAARFFPEGAIHVVVVDPGVGTERRPIAGQVGGQFVVGPDNGVFTRMIEVCEQNGDPIRFVHLNRPEFWLQQVSYVFHGRDIFAPVAAHLAMGRNLIDLGTPINDVVRLNLPKPIPTLEGLQGEVIHIDHFGNISTCIMRQDIGDNRILQVQVKDQAIEDFVNTFGEKSPGSLVCLFGSNDNLLICEVNGNAAQRLQVRVGDVVRVLLEKKDKV